MRYRAAKTQIVSTSVAAVNGPAALDISVCVKRYGLSDYTLRKLAKQGKIASIRAGVGENGKILINAALLEAYLNGTAN